VLGSRADGRIRALTGNFIEVGLPARTAVRRGEPVDVVVGQTTGDTTEATVAGRPDWAVA